MARVGLHTGAPVQGGCRQREMRNREEPCCRGCRVWRQQGWRPGARRFLSLNALLCRGLGEAFTPTPSWMGRATSPSSQVS